MGGFLFVFPVPGFPLGDPLDGLGDPLFAGGVGLCVGDPFGILTTAPQGELIEVLLRGLVLLQGGEQRGMELRRRFGPAGDLHAGVERPL